MGFLDLFVPKAELTVEAADLAPVNVALGGNWVAGIQTATRAEAIGVPTIARARQIICSTLSGLPFETINEGSNEVIPSPRVLNQPDPRIPGSVFWAWIYEDLLFSGAGYARVLDRYSDTGRIRAMERIEPYRVSTRTNAIGTEIVGYYVDGTPIDPSQLVVIPGLDEGILNRAGRTIRAAHALEKAAYNFAMNPIPQTVIKPRGVTLTADKIRALAATWKKARQENSTAIINQDVDVSTLGYDPKALQMNEARMYVSLELCRAINIPAWFASSEPNSFTYSNSVSQRRDLVDLSLRPLIIAVEQRLSMADFTPMGSRVRIDLDDFLRGNPLERAQVYQILHGIQDASGTPVMSIDEIRKDEDLIK